MLAVPGLSLGPVSNVATAFLLGLPAVIDAVDVWRAGGSFPEWVEDTVVIGQALIVTGAVNQLVRLGIQRPRPIAYGIDPADGRARGGRGRGWNSATLLVHTEGVRSVRIKRSGAG